MKINLASLAFALVLPLAVNAQKSGETFNSGSQNISAFTADSKKFNDWSVSVGGGTAIMQSADLTSIKNGNGKNQFGYSHYVSINKAITHIFGLNLQYDRGETHQGYVDLRDHVAGLAARTQFQGVSILGDANLSNLLRRTDNMSPFRWALHAYAGIGTLSYTTYAQSTPTTVGQSMISEVKMGTSSLFGQAGAGLKFKLNNRIDIEGRVMYLFSGDDQFDGGGEQYSAVNMIEDQNSDNAILANLGLTFNLGKHSSHVMWHDPMQEIYYKLDVLANKNKVVEVCKKGDQDNDGVCDDWDRELNTPAGARVDGSGVALDADLDGVIDLNDKCVTVPGNGSPDGCPVGQADVVGGDETEAVEETEAMKNVLFDTNKSTLRAESKVKLDNAASIIKKSDAKFKIEGHTDNVGSDEHNLKLSKSRAAAVVKALETRGVKSGQLQSEGFGESQPACDNATEEGRQCNRRVEVKTVN